MPVESYTATQYTVTCDRCGRTEVCPDGNAEGVHGKRQAIKWANMHKRNQMVLCNKCFKRWNGWKTSSIMRQVWEE